jgi:hypothetical protein
MRLCTAYQHPGTSVVDRFRSGQIFPDLDPDPTVPS